LQIKKEGLRSLSGSSTAANIEVKTMNSQDVSGESAASRFSELRINCIGNARAIERGSKYTAVRKMFSSATSAPYASLATAASTSPVSF
jgi:hypothetical protein